MRLRAAIFDFDGLILDTENAEFASWNDVYGEHGTALKFEDWVVCVGTSGAFDAIAHLERLTGRTLDRGAIVARHRAFNRPRLEALPVLPGVEDRLAEARALGLRTAIASSSPREWIDDHLGRLGLLARFDVLATRTDRLLAKPRPDIYLAALAALGIRPDEAVAFEDSRNGILGAKAAGIFCVAVPNSVTAWMDLTPADRRVGSLREVSLADLGRTAFNGAVVA